MSKKLAIIGASGHGKVIADIALLNEYSDIIFLDDNVSVKECAGFPVVDTIQNANKYSNRDFIVAIGNNRIRKKITVGLKTVRLASLIHPSAIVSRRVSIGPGTVVMANAVINSDVTIGEGCIVNTSSSIDHDCKLGDYCHLSPGVRLAGNVVIGDNCWMGIGVSVINDILIGDKVFVGAGGAVVSDLLKSGQYIGIPAKLRTGGDL